MSTPLFDTLARIAADARAFFTTPGLADAIESFDCTLEGTRIKGEGFELLLPRIEISFRPAKKPAAKKGGAK